MPHRVSPQRVPVESPSAAILELYPEISQEIDRRIQHSVTQVKYWVIAGVLGTLVTTIGFGIPAVYNLGRLTIQIEMIQMRLDQIDSKTKGPRA